MTENNAQSAAVLEALSAAFGADVLPGGASPKYLQDWSGCPGGEPLAILRPRSTDELSRMLAICHAHAGASFAAIARSTPLSRRAHAQYKAGRSY